MFDHVLDLIFQSYESEREEIDDEDGPENRNIKERDECAEDGHQDGARCRNPELLLGEVGEVRTKFIINSR